MKNILGISSILILLSGGCLFAKTPAHDVKPVETRHEVKEIDLEQAIRARLLALHEQQANGESLAQAPAPVKTIDQIWEEIERSAAHKDALEESTK